MMLSYNRKINLISNKQSGVVLVVSLIFLLLLTLISLTGMQSTSLEEKMAGNMSDKMIAFQAAEAALKIGEKNVIDAGGKEDCLPNSTNDGLYLENRPNFATDAIWSSNDVRDVNLDNKKLDRAKYVIECMSNTPNRYRITAYAKGLTDDAVVILQSVYKVGDKTEPN